MTEPTKLDARTRATLRAIERREREAGRVGPLGVLGLVALHRLVQRRYGNGIGELWRDLRSDCLEVGDPTQFLGSVLNRQPAPPHRRGNALGFGLDVGAHQPAVGLLVGDERLLHTPNNSPHSAP